jgi:hypothetical protein
MIQELPNRNPPLVPFRYKRYFESKNQKIRIFGLCEVTGKNFEIFAPVEGFFVYLQGFKSFTKKNVNSSSPVFHQKVPRAVGIKLEL